MPQFSLDPAAPAAEAAAELASLIVTTVVHDETDLSIDALNEALMVTDGRVDRAYLLAALASLAEALTNSTAPPGPERLSETILAMRANGYHIAWCAT